MYRLKMNEIIYAIHKAIQTETNKNETNNRKYMKPTNLHAKYKN